MLGLLAVVHLGAVELQAADPRVGAWALVSAESSLEPANKLVIVSGKEGVHVVMTGENHLDFTAKGNGHETAVPGNPAFDQVELRRIDKKSSQVTEKKGGTIVTTVLEKLSADSKELTLTTARKGHPEQVSVWERTGGAKVANDPVSGEWTEDLSKSRMRQGLVVKIDADPTGAVHFAGDFTYTARFDGKRYDLKDSRNDTVSLQQVDAHTVESTYRRDEQVTEKDRWVVAADGQHFFPIQNGGESTSGDGVAHEMGAASGTACLERHTGRPEEQRRDPLVAAARISRKTAFAFEGDRRQVQKQMVIRVIRHDVYRARPHGLHQLQPRAAPLQLSLDRFHSIPRPSRQPRGTPIIAGKWGRRKLGRSF